MHNVLFFFMLNKNDSLYIPCIGGALLFSWWPGPIMVDRWAIEREFCVLRKLTDFPFSLFFSLALSTHSPVLQSALHLQQWQSWVGHMWIRSLMQPWLLSGLKCVQMEGPHCAGLASTRELMCGVGNRSNWTLSLHAGCRVLARHRPSAPVTGTLVPAVSDMLFFCGLSTPWTLNRLVWVQFNESVLWSLIHRAVC